uniref:Transposase Tc1-like domain-containing protein n=1 Tax=Caenorhabditis japonica TaxID=281687 RepID=A0A8R1DXU3_CAEJA
MAIICGRQMGLDMPTLAKQFKTSKSVIWATSNTPNLSKATGRPLKTLSRDDRIIVRMSKKNPRLTSTDINSELEDHYGVQVSKDTVKRRLRHALLFRRRPVNKPMIPDKNRSARLDDESKYLMIGTNRVTLVRRPGDKRNDPKYQVPTVKHGGGNVMMWGCFHANGVGSLIRITGTMESYMYKDILEKEMIPSGRSQMGTGWLFQQDNDPKHSSHFFKDWTHSIDQQLLSLSPLWVVLQSSTQREQAQLDIFKDFGKSTYQISQCLNSIRNFIRRYLANPIFYGTRASSGRPRKLAEQDESRVVKYLLNQEKSVNHTLGELQLGFCRRTVLNIIRRSGVVGTYYQANMTPSPTKSDAADDNKENSNQQVTNKDERTLTPAKKEEVTTEHWISVNTKDKTTGQYLHQIFIAKTRTLWKLHEFEWKMYDVYEDFPIVDFKDARPFATMLDVAEWFTKPEEERNALRAAGKVPNKIYAIATHSGFEKGLLNMALAKKTEKSPAERVMSPIMPAKAAKIFGISPLDQLGAAIASNPRRGYPVADTVSQPIRTLVSPFMVTVSDLVKKDYKVELAKQVDGLIHQPMQLNQSKWCDENFRIFQRLHQGESLPENRNN